MSQHSLSLLNPNALATVKNHLICFLYFLKTNVKNKGPQLLQELVAPAYICWFIKIQKRKKNELKFEIFQESFNVYSKSESKIPEV